MATSVETCKAHNHHSVVNYLNHKLILDQKEEYGALKTFGARTWNVVTSGILVGVGNLEVALRVLLYIPFKTIHFFFSKNWTTLSGQFNSYVHGLDSAVKATANAFNTLFKQFNDAHINGITPVKVEEKKVEEEVKKEVKSFTNRVHQLAKDGYAHVKNDVKNSYNSVVANPSNAIAPATVIGLGLLGLYFTGLAYSYPKTTALVATGIAAYAFRKPIANAFEATNKEFADMPTINNKTLIKTAIGLQAALIALHIFK